jgi:hypothetical protein
MAGESAWILRPPGPLSNGSYTPETTRPPQFKEMAGEYLLGNLQYFYGHMDLSLLSLHDGVILRPLDKGSQYGLGRTNRDARTEGGVSAKRSQTCNAGSVVRNSNYGPVNRPREFFAMLAGRSTHKSI